ncbi:hypothetical protein ABWH92_06215 [Ahrensia marina]|uniref:hypothetical protein n=1 Tax=Ahrensia marina TaxID=1514904 RepID=UPI0035D0D2DE
MKIDQYPFLAVALLVGSTGYASAETSQTTTHVIAFGQATGQIKLANRVILQTAPGSMAEIATISDGAKVQLSYGINGQIKGAVIQTNPNVSPRDIHKS